MVVWLFGRPKAELVSFVTRLEVVWCWGLLCWALDYVAFGGLREVVRVGGLLVVF